VSEEFPIQARRGGGGVVGVKARSREESGALQLVKTGHKALSHGKEDFEGAKKGNKPAKRGSGEGRKGPGVGRRVVWISKCKKKCLKAQYATAQSPARYDSKTMRKKKTNQTLF